MRTSPKKIAIVIPCYNEAKSIAHVIERFSRAQLNRRHLQCYFYVVDNNSTDDTAHQAKQAGAQVISESRKGKGFALRAGFRAVAADIDFVVMLDGDDTYSPEEVVRMIEPLQNDFCDVVVGSRLGGRIQTAAMPPFNRFGNWLFTNAVRVLYRANVTDVLSGYFAWKKETLDSLYPHLKSEGFAIEMEMITKMARMGHRLTSVPISYHPRAGDSHLRPIHDGVRILKMLLKNLAWSPGRLPVTLPARPRKIVFVSDSVYPYMKGGKEKRLYEISQRLADMGFEVHIYTMKWWKGKGPIMQKKVTLHAICRHYQLYKGNRRSIKQAIFFGLACFKLLSVKLDVLDVDHMPFFPIISSWIVCRLRLRKFYGTWHEALSREEWAGYMGRGSSVASAIERLSIKLPHTITAASAHTKKALATLHGRVEDVALVASGIDSRRLLAIQPAAVRCDVLFVGRLVKDKNVNKLIEAIRYINKDIPEIQCIVIGAGPEKERLAQLVEKRELRKNVVFLEPTFSADEIYAYMKAAKVFCLPSIREGFSLVTVEALGCGTPVVTSDAPANAAKQLVQDGQNGSIVSCEPAELAKALLYWVKLPQKPEVSQTVANFDWDTLARQQAEVYTR
ncbi:MAG TPA: glycosyltransferase [Candidatus Saccharimonadales bacterium]